MCFCSGFFKESEHFQFANGKYKEPSVWNCVGYAKNLQTVYSIIKRAHKHSIKFLFAPAILSSSKYMKLDGLTLEGSHALPHSSRAPLCSNVGGGC